MYTWVNQIRDILKEYNEYLMITCYFYMVSTYTYTYYTCIVVPNYQICISYVDDCILFHEYLFQCFINYNNIIPTNL